MKKRYKIPGIFKESTGLNPMCDECGEQLVKFRNKWVCKTDMKLKIQAFPGWEPEEVEFQVLYPNRESRRREG